MATISGFEMVDQDTITATDLRQCADDAVQVGSDSTLMACYRISWIDDVGQDMAPDLQALIIHLGSAQRSRIGIALNADAQWGDLEPYAGGNESAGFESAVYQATWDYLNDADAWAARN